MDALKSNDAGNVSKVIAWDEKFQDVLPAFNKLGDSFEQAALLATKALPPQAQARLRMDLKNPAYKRFIAGRLNTFLQDLNVQQSEIVRRAIQRSFSQAKSPSQIANEIVDHIGLNDRQSTALSNYRADLEKKNIAPKKVEFLTEQYSGRLLKQRAKMIARTEIQNANNLGELAVWKESVNDGSLDPETTYKVWSTDRTPCPLCRSMEGKKVKLNDLWTLPDGRKVNVPSEIHPSCFCIQRLEF